MIRKIVAVWVSLAILFGFVVVVDVITDITPTVKATTLYVNETGSGGAYTSIQDAINDSKDGYTVFVYNGTYYENVVVNKTINLIGEHRDITIIDGSGTGDAVYITADGVNITGFTLTNGGNVFDDSGIQLESNFNTVSNCNISYNNYYGIFVNTSSNNTIIDNNFLGNDYGIFLNIAPSNLITNCTFYDTGRGIIIFKSSNDVQISDCSFNFNWIGIMIQDSEKIEIVNCKLYNHGDIGIDLDSSSKVQIIDCEIYSNTNIGIKLSSSTSNHIINCSLYGNDKGIFIGTSDFNQINRCEVHDQLYHGIYLGGSSDNNQVTRCNVYNNPRGIYLNHASNNFVFYNNIITNGIQAYDDSGDNHWDNGYPLGGNYWSDYTGSDDFKGPYQTIPGKDNIGDIAFTNIDGGAGARDNYPLIEPYSNKTLENYTILKKGWNLISIPLIQHNQNLQKVLEMIDGWYDAVQWYEISNLSDSWKHHKVGKSFGNDLFVLNESMGFLIHITNPGDTIFLYNGTQPSVNQTILLHPGWNMVGYPSLTSYNRTEGLNNLTFNDQVDAIWSYDAATQKWEEMGESDYFIVGRGYYIHAKSKCEWEVPIQ